MKIATKRAVSVFVALIMVFSLIPTVVFASGQEMEISASTVSGCPGDTVTVTIRLSNNPGIASLKFKVSYNEEYLSLNAVSFGEGFGAYVTAPEPYQSPQTISFVSPLEPVTTNGLFASLSFKISPEAPDGSSSDVTITYDEDDVFDSNYDNVKLNITNGKVQIYTGIPGDVNGDKTVNNKDAILLFRYVAGWAVTVDSAALDVTGDGKINNKDAITLFRYVAGWQPPAIELPLHYGPICEHNLQPTAAVPATCTEPGNIAYWYCDVCGKYFSDANATKEIQLENTVLDKLGHDPVEIPRVEPTATSVGYTAGVKCARCKMILVEPIVIPIPTPTTHSITYFYANGDSYLMNLYANGNLDFGDPNRFPVSYEEDKGLQLSDITGVAGYTFEGWYTSSGMLVTAIAPGSTSDYQLYAHWKKTEYTIQFDSPLSPVESVTYTVDTGKPLANPGMDGYLFVGWTDSDGKLVTAVPVGMTGHITLHANWTSKRNQTRPNDYSNDAPAIVVDEENGIFSFAYYIGCIENVPLYTIEEFPNMVKGLEITRTISTSSAIIDSTSSTIAETISNATTKSSSWSLSSDWLENMGVSESHSNEVSEEQVHEATVKAEQTGKWDISKSYGGSSSKEATAKTENGCSAKINAEYSAGISASIPLEGCSLGANVGYKIGGEIASEHKDSLSQTRKEERNWNTDMGYSTSNSLSTSETTAVKMAQAISSTYGKTYSVSSGGSEVNSKSTAQTTTDAREYASQFAFTTEKSRIETDTYRFSSEAEGYYRLVCAGTLDVYAVVVYDVATATYSVYTYSVLREEIDNTGKSVVKTSAFMDFSANTANFDDYENGVLPFDVPTYVRDYVDDAIMGTNGLVVDPDTGRIIEFDTTQIEDYNTNGALVLIPDFVRIDHGDGTYDAVKVTGFDADVFAEKNICAVGLNKYITEIPDGAFEGCENMEVIYAPSVTSIGQNAFKGCTSLSSFTAAEQVTYIGTNAFEGVKELNVTASSPAVVLAATSSGAKKIIVNLARMTGELKDASLTIPSSTEYYEFQGANTVLHGVSIESDAATTVVNGATFVDNTRIPLKLSSSSVTLNRVSVEASGFAMILTAPETDLSLFGNVTLSTDGESAVLSNSVNLMRSSSTVAGKLILNSNYLICGTMTGDKYLSFTEGSGGTVVYITETQFENLLKTYHLLFNANGGIVDPESKLAYVGSELGALPTPSRDYYTFTGWFTSASGGTQITESYVWYGANDLTLYAHWELNPTSDWVAASEMPDGAQVVERKWTYTLTSYTTSSSSSLSGWTRYDSSYTWSNWGAWSDWSTNYVTSNDSTQVETRTGYHYYYYLCPHCGAHMYQYTTCFTWAGGCGGNIPSSAYHALRSATPYSSTSDFHGTGVNYTDNTDEGRAFAFTSSSSQYYVAPATQYRYRTRSQVWTYYYKKTEELESEVYPTGDNISNIKEWVKYRAK